MRLYGNRRGISGDVLKIAAASVLALALFAILASFAAWPLEADSYVAATGLSLLNQTQNTSLEILAHK
jgi:hypothetical protein